jgi:glycosyltransferase involved in cell wall biosynthesis
MVLIVFFTRAVSLEVWLNKGLFDREKLIYEEHLKSGTLSKVYWITYGSKDNALSKNLKNNKKMHAGIEVVGMPSFFNIPKIGNYLYSILMPFYYKNIFVSSDILKINQMDGSWSAVIAKIIYKKPLILRTGYTLSLFLKKSNKSKATIWLSNAVEKIAYKFCDIAVVSSYQDKKYLLEKYKFLKNKLKVISNYIDISVFKPMNTKKYSNRLLFIGRLNHQKNLFNLIDAAYKTNMILDIYGKGELEDELRLYANKNHVTVNFNNTVPNSELPKIINHYKLYLLPSFYEGTPKTLLEAMACGLICIGTDVIGINEIIENEINGYLIKGTDSESISVVVNKAVDNNREIMRNNAIKTVRKNYNLELYVASEKSIFLNIN